jgi:two-component system phosphate regulon sensor histidine kinase PhoR
VTFLKHWWLALFRVLAILGVGAALGFFFGSVASGLLVSLMVVLLYWSYQMFRVEQWLSEVAEEPPQAAGVWGLLFDYIHRLQSQSAEAQGRLESSLHYLQDSLKSMRDAAIITDPWGNIAWMNDSAGSLLGISLDKDEGRPLVSKMRLPNFSDYLAVGDFKVPLRIPPSSEQKRCLQVEVSSFGGGDKLIFIKDITEQYKLEMMRRDFVGNVSHELRTPLTVLKGYVENLQSLDSDLVSKIQRPLVQMDMQVVRMEMLLKDLLWLSRIETIEGADKTLPINMTDLVAEIIEDLRAAYPERKIDTHLEHDDVILGDATELHSAVSNLVVNALKYSGHDDLVTVEWKLDSGLPTLTVRDEGEGIKPQHIPRLTERFYRVDKSRNQATGGTGLGLAIVKHVAVSHNAELLIDSVYGQGSVFSMVFKPHQKGIQAALQ